MATVAALCRSFHHRIDSITATVIGTRWAKYDPFVKALFGMDERASYAIDGAYTAFGAQHGWGVASQFPGRVRITRIEWRARARLNKDRPVLSRQEWGDVGREVAAIRGEVARLLDFFAGTRGNHEAVPRFRDLAKRIDAAAAVLDSLVRLQHPDWETPVLTGAAGPSRRRARSRELSYQSRT